MKRVKLFLVLSILFLSFSQQLLAHGKVLIVITNNKEVKATLANKDTIIAGGYELSEVAEAYMVFTASGLEVDFLSPKGGKTYAEPEEKMKEVNKEFLAIPNIKSKLENTLAPSDIDASNYQAIYFAGGKTMWDFPNNTALQSLTAKIYESEGVVGAVCHGPAALVNVKLSDGSLLIEGKKVSSFTDREEQLFSKTSKFLPFFLQEKLTSLGADFQEAPPMFDQAVVDQRLVTGQNPLSTYSVAEEMVKLLGKTPPARTWTDLSYTLGVIKVLILEDHSAAKKFLKTNSGDHKLNRELLQSYSIYAFNGYLGDLAKNKGLELLQFVTEAFPENAKSHEELAKAYHKLGKDKLALKSVEQSLSLEPSSATAKKLKQEIEG